jgi:hypothetical protein
VSTWSFCLWPHSSIVIVYLHILGEDVDELRDEHEGRSALYDGVWGEVMEREN